MKKADVVSTLMDFQNQLLAGIAFSLIDADTLYKAIWAGVNAVSESPKDEF